jgi:hypothetical protein
LAGGKKTATATAAAADENTNAVWKKKRNLIFNAKQLDTVSRFISLFTHASRRTNIASAPWDSLTRCSHPEDFQEPGTHLPVKSIVAVRDTFFSVLPRPFYYCYSPLQCIDVTASARTGTLT